MSYQRKQEDKRRMKKVTMEVTGGWPAGAYYTEREGQNHYLKRCWKSEGKNSHWAKAKKYSHKVYRRFVKKNDFYSKKAYDLWWIVW